MNTNKRLPPHKAIRKKCLSCMGGSYSLVSDCVSSGCALWPFRAGNKEAPGRESPLTAIRAFCLNCATGEERGVRFCSDPGCPLFRHRLGEKPVQDKLPWAGEQPAP